MAKVTWLGHSAFKIEAGRASVVLDPFLAPQYHLSPEDVGAADIILITHDHGDHTGSVVQLARETGALVGCMVGTAQALMQKGVPAAQIFNGIGFNIGGTLSHKGVNAVMTQAFHSSDSGSPAGYIVTMPDGLVFYHAGDTGIFSSMALLAEIYDIQLGLLPIGGIFTMDARQAARACKLLALKQVIPMHWGTFPALAQSPDEFVAKTAAIAPDCRCLAMKPGESLEVEPSR